MRMHLSNSAVSFFFYTRPILCLLSQQCSSESSSPVVVIWSWSCTYNVHLATRFVVRSRLIVYHGAAINSHLSILYRLLLCQLILCDVLSLTAVVLVFCSTLLDVILYFRTWKSLPSETIQFYFHELTLYVMKNSVGYFTI